MRQRAKPLCSDGLVVDFQEAQRIDTGSRHLPSLVAKTQQRHDMNLDEKLNSRHREAHCLIDVWGLQVRYYTSWALHMGICTELRHPEQPLWALGVLNSVALHLLAVSRPLD
jgi:hypothetical protein